MKHVNLWATPVWEFDFDDVEHLNQLLLAEIYEFYKNSNLKTNKINLFDHNLPGMTELANRVNVCVDQAMKAGNFPMQFQGIQRGWATFIQPGKQITPHSHHLTRLVAVYYPQVVTDQGDLNLLDPRSMDLLSDATIDNTRRRTYYRIPQRAGLLILFPGNLNHFSSQNNSNQTRISIAMNLDLRDLTDNL